jgi:hypothetical protein
MEIMIIESIIKAGMIEAEKESKRQIEIKKKYDEISLSIKNILLNKNNWVAGSICIYYNCWVHDLCTLLREPKSNLIDFIYKTLDEMLPRIEEYKITKEKQLLVTGDCIVAKYTKIEPNGCLVM